MNNVLVDVSAIYNHHLVPHKKKKRPSGQLQFVNDIDFHQFYLTHTHIYFEQPNLLERSEVQRVLNTTREKYKGYLPGFEPRTLHILCIVHTN
jgi:hypothetical protein